MMFKMRIFSFCLPRDPQDKSRGLSEISFDIELPFIPQVGGAISVSPNHDIGEIDEVIYIPYEYDEYGRICIHLKEPDSLDEFQTLAAEGWKSA